MATAGVPRATGELYAGVPVLFTQLAHTRAPIVVKTVDGTYDAAVDMAVGVLTRAALLGEVLLTLLGLLTRAQLVKNCFWPKEDQTENQKRNSTNATTDHDRRATTSGNLGAVKLRVGVEGLRVSVLD